MSNDPSPVDRTTVLEVTGMTCGHCVSAVTQELETIKEVSKVSVILREGGTSEVTVVSDTPLEEDALRAAADEARYGLTAARADHCASPPPPPHPPTTSHPCPPPRRPPRRSVRWTWPSTG